MYKLYYRSGYVRYCDSYDEALMYKRYLDSRGDRGKIKPVH